MITNLKVMEKDEDQRSGSESEDEEGEELTFGTGHVPNCNLKSRFYDKKYPEADDYVVVRVHKVEETGAYVKLLEYNGIEGMIMSSEFTRKRTKSVSRLIKVGKQEVVVVLRVDQEKGYIDLSKRKVKPNEIPEVEKHFKNAKKVRLLV